MTPTIQEPVSGREETVNSSEPLAALSQLYRALSSRDIVLMEQNWDANDEAVMDNPLGGIKRGWVQIRSVYQRLFASPGRYRFEFYDYSLQRHSEVFMAIGRERGQLVSADGLILELAIRTTRIFRWANDRWRQIHHHGSIDNPDMLARYQQTVLKRVA
jgi:hypothetical protein